MNKEFYTLDRYLTDPDRKNDRQTEIKAFDWRGKPLYTGETVYSIEGEYVREDDLQAYIDQNVGKPVEI